MSFNVPPAASIAFSMLWSAFRVCSRTLSPPTMFFRASQAVCPETNTIFLPLAITTWENPCGKLGNKLFGFTYSFGINQKFSKVKRYTVRGGCIVWFDAGFSPALENIVSLCVSKPELVGKYLNDLPNLWPAVGEAHINVLTASIPHHLGVTLLSAAIIADPNSTMPSHSGL